MRKKCVHYVVPPFNIANALLVFVVFCLMPDSYPCVHIQIVDLFKLHVA